MAQALKGICYKRAIWMLSHKKLNEEKVNLLKKLLKNNDNSQVWSDTMKYELLFSSKIIYSLNDDEFEKAFAEIDNDLISEAINEIQKLPDEKIEEKRISIKYLNDILEFKKEKSPSLDFLKLYSQMIPLILEDMAQFPGIEAKKSENFIKKLKDEKNNMLWHMILDSLSINRILIFKNSYYKNHQKALKIIIAFRQYEILHNGEPKNLNDLVETGLLKEMPIDEWTGKTIEFDAANRVIRYKHFRREARKREVKF